MSQVVGSSGNYISSLHPLINPFLYTLVGGGGVVDYHEESCLRKMAMGETRLVDEEGCSWSLYLRAGGAFQVQMF